MKSIMLAAQSLMCGHNVSDNNVTKGRKWVRLGQMINICIMVKQLQMECLTCLFSWYYCDENVLPFEFMNELCCYMFHT